MFKKIILILAMASVANADVKNTTAVETLNGGLGGTLSGSLTYALNNALTGTSSSAIDLNGTLGLWLTLTSTASANVLVYFSNSNVTYTTGASQMYILQSPGSYPISPKARYVSFYNGGSTPTNRVSASYYSVAGSTAFLTSSYVYASATAMLVTTSGLAVNVSTVAGATCNDCRAYWSTRDAVGVYWDYSNSATIPTILGHFTATSVTATLDDGFIDGQIIHFKPTGASSVNVFVTVKKRQ